MRKMKKLQESSSSSSEYERLTIAYTESIPRSDSIESLEEETSTYTISSDSLETPTTQESFISLFAEIDRMKDKEDFFGYEPVWRTLSMSDGPKLGGLSYFYRHSVFQLFSLLMSHLLANTPEEPIPFLISLVDRCMKYRDEGEEPPLLFDDRHIESVYTALDPMDQGTISFSQYVAGMTTLGLTHFNLLPNDLKRKDSNVPKEVFIREAKGALLDQLDSIIGKSRQRDSTVSFQNGSLDRSSHGENEDEGEKISSGSTLIAGRVHNGGANKASERSLRDSLIEKGTLKTPHQRKSSSVSSKFPPLLVEKSSNEKPTLQSPQQLQSSSIPINSSQLPASKSPSTYISSAEIK